MGNPFLLLSAEIDEGAASQCYPTAMLAYRFVLNLLHAQCFTHSAPCIIDDASGATFNIKWYHGPARRFHKLLYFALLHVYGVVRFSSHRDVS